MPLNKDNGLNFSEDAMGHSAVVIFRGVRNTTEPHSGWLTATAGHPLSWSQGNSTVQQQQSHGFVALALFRVPAH